MCELRLGWWELSSAGGQEKAWNCKGALWLQRKKQVLALRLSGGGSIRAIIAEMGLRPGRGLWSCERGNRPSLELGLQWPSELLRFACSSSWPLP